MSVTLDTTTYLEQHNVAIYAQYTFTTTGTGTSIDISTYPLKSFSIQVVGSGGNPTLWNLILEGSLDGTNFDTFITHTNLIGINVIASLGQTLLPIRYFRPRLTSLTLGGSTALVAHILGSV